MFVTDTIRAVSACLLAGVQEVWVKYRGDRFAQIVFLSTVLVAVVAIFLHGFAIDAPKGTFARRWLNLGRDNSLQEFYGYGLCLVSAACFITAWRRTALFGYLTAALVLLFMFVDDAFSYHESVGKAMNRRFDMPSFGQIYGSQFGELVAWGAAGAVFAVLFLATTRRSPRVQVRIFAVLAMMIGAVGFFAVGVDLIHTYTRLPELTYLEDGGELIALAFSTALAVTIARNPWYADDRPLLDARSVERAGYVHDPVRRSPRLVDLHAEPERQGAVAQGVSGKHT